MKALFLTILMTVTALSGWSQTRIKDLKVQNTKEPIAVEDSRPVFSWKMESDITGQHQTAYRINVIRESDGSTIWDSGKVADGASTGIRYLGVGLQPEMGYTWNLQVWDKDGNVYSENSRFETGIMNPRISAWKGAEWIGSTYLKLDATSQSLFEIRTDFRIIEGNTASLVFGADDFRLRNGFFNGYGVANDCHYIRVEIETGENPQVRIYRVGYFPEDKTDTPFMTINDETYPQNNLREIIADGDSHSLQVAIEVSNITIHIDGKQLKTTAGTGRRNFWEARGMTLNKLGSGGDVPLQDLQQTVELVLGFLAAGLVLQQHRLGDLLADLNDGVQAGQGVLEDHGDRVTTDLAHILLGDLQKILAVIDDFTGFRNGVAGLDTQNSLGGNRLTGTGLTNDGQGLAPLQVEGDVTDSLQGTAGGTEGDF